MLPVASQTIRHSAAGFALRPLASDIGVEVLGLDLWRALDRETFRAVRDVYQAHGVILIRGQSLTEEKQVAFGGNFGPLASVANRNSGQANARSSASLISNVRDQGRLIGSLGCGPLLFHFDECYAERPCKTALLYGIEVPGEGGETIFADMRRAYEALPPDLAQAIEGRQALNVFDVEEEDHYGKSAIDLYSTIPADVKRFSHPIVRSDPVSGRKSLFVNRCMTLCVEGMERSESDALLLRLFEHQEQACFQYAHRWRVGDLIMWDNRRTLHARRDFPSWKRRILRRVTVLDDAAA